MIYQFDLKNDARANQPFVSVHSRLVSTQLDLIRDLGRNLTYVPIKTYDSLGAVDADGAHFYLTDETRWVYDHLAEVIQRENSGSYQFDIHGFYENLYFNRYSGEKRQFFDWHSDMGAKTPRPRKLTAVLNLTPEDLYVGGQLEIMGSSGPISISRERGLLTLFPSHKPHRVTRVESGVRETLVAFVVGPNFR